MHNGSLVAFMCPSGLHLVSLPLIFATILL
jgi:hypothetical protein